jgi:Flp pilus assembly protein CpaB
MPEIRDVTRRLRRSYLRHRRLATAGLAAIAVVAAVHVVAPPAAATKPVVVASHDLLSGTMIGTGDLHVVHVAPDLVPAGAATRLSGLAGRIVAGPMRAGEPVTDQRMLGAALIAGYPAGVVAAPVRIQDGDVVSLLRVGDRIDIYSSDGDPSVPAPRVASDVAVVSLPVPDDSARDGALVVVAVTEADAARLAQASATTQLSISIRG